MQCSSVEANLCQAPPDQASSPKTQPLQMRVALGVRQEAGQSFTSAKRATGGMFLMAVTMRDCRAGAHMLGFTDTEPDTRDMCEHVLLAHPENPPLCLPMTLRKARKARKLREWQATAPAESRAPAAETAGSSLSERQALGWSHPGPSAGAHCDRPGPPRLRSSLAGSQRHHG